ncbi:hypothetical protein ASE86_02075 [Sphingomonas sp. Leaf33]|nr:hypothetical protein ASE86_02075 [Sphingomonas sp. Leaf33]
MLQYGLNNVPQKECTCGWIHLAVEISRLFSKLFDQLIVFRDGIIKKSARLKIRTFGIIILFCLVDFIITRLFVITLTRFHARFEILEYIVVAGSGAEALLWCNHKLPYQMLQLLVGIRGVKLYQQIISVKFNPNLILMPLSLQKANGRIELNRWVFQNLPLFVTPVECQSIEIKTIFENIVSYLPLAPIKSSCERCN